MSAGLETTDCRKEPAALFQEKFLVHCANANDPLPLLCFDGIRKRQGKACILGRFFPYFTPSTVNASRIRWAAKTAGIQTQDGWIFRTRPRG